MALGFVFIGFVVFGHSQVRTDALQIHPTTGAEKLVIVCHTTMVALDKDTMRPVKGPGPPPVPPLLGTTGKPQEANYLARYYRSVVLYLWVLQLNKIVYKMPWFCSFITTFP